MICRRLVFACALAVAGIVHARELAIDRMPVSPFADTEVSTNITINASNISCENLKFQFQGTPANNLELAFGTDANANGVLDAGEIETRFGWRGGRYFIENVQTWEQLESAQSPSSQSFSININLNIRYDSQQVRKVTVDGVNAAAFESLVADVPPAWIWRREWNMMRATRRGAEPPADWIAYEAALHGTAIKLR